MKSKAIISALLMICCASAMAQDKTKPAKLMALAPIDTVMVTPTLSDSSSVPLKLKLHKKKAHASYYSDKFNGRRTASGQKFHNSKYTAAHRKFPFGTKLKVTNEANGKSVIVIVNDRGPFSKVREIDMSKKAFMEISHAKGAGGLNVTIEEILPPSSPKPKS